MDDAKTKPSPGPEQPSDGAPQAAAKIREYGGPRGLEPTRYGDWERNGRCIDF